MKRTLSIFTLFSTAPAAMAETGNTADYSNKFKGSVSSRHIPAPTMATLNLQAITATAVHRFLNK